MSARACALALLLTFPLQPVDDAVRSAVLTLRRPGLDPVMHAVSDKARVILPAGLVLSLVLGPQGRAFFAESALALAPLNAAVEGLKWIVGRVRPDGDRNRRNSSFPSSHAANAFTLAAVLGRRFRRAAIPAWLVALLVAFSRLYLDRHWLTDVIGSLALALGASWLAAWAILRWHERRNALRTS